MSKSNGMTRNEIKKMKQIKEVKKRNANSVKELELLMTVTGMHIIAYYDKRPVRRMLAKMGIRRRKIVDRFTEKAKMELSNVNYDARLWKANYGNRLG